MSDPEEQEEEVGRVTGPPPPPTAPEEDGGPQQEDECQPTETLSLSRTKLICVPQSLLSSGTLKNLYLEGNQISNIPALFFASLPLLQWLDLRNNLIGRLPAEIGSHRSLKTLLLEGNPMAELPPELGNVITLRGLNLRNCPITFPPQDILHQGVQGILHYLRSIMAEREVGKRRSPPVLPVVEKLQLSELSSVEDQDDEELQKFKELKEKLFLLDTAELRSLAQCGRNQKWRFHTVTIGRKTTSKAGLIPELLLSDAAQQKSPEELRQAAIREVKERQAQVEQGRKNKEALQKWQTQARITQARKMSEYERLRSERQRRQMEADGKPGAENIMNPAEKHAATVSSADGHKSSLPAQLQQQIRARVEMIQERHRNPRGTASEQMAAARQDVEELTKIQMQLSARRNLGGDGEKCFTVYTGDTLFSLPDE